MPQQLAEDRTKIMTLLIDILNMNVGDNHNLYAIFATKNLHIIVQ